MQASFSRRTADDDFDDDEEEDDGAEAAADALLEDMRRLRAAVSTAVSDVGGREESANAAANQLHDRLNKTAMDIIADVVSGEAEMEQSGVTSPVTQSTPVPHSTPAPVLDATEPEALWHPETAAAPSAPPAAARSSKRFGVQPERGRPDSGVASVVSDISRLAGKPLLADGDGSGASNRPGAPRRPGGLTSGSHVGGRGRGAGSRPLPRQ